jgi:hypothetical protein
MIKNMSENETHILFAKDELGHDMLLKGNGPVVMEWEKPYFETCVRSLEPLGDVLEVGFGLGYSAEEIQKHHPKSHTIIEWEPELIQRALEWARHHSSVKIIQGHWHDHLEKLGLFDTILFHTHHFFNDEDHFENTANSKAIEKLKQQVKETGNDFKKVLKELKGIKFSEGQIDDFIRYLKGSAKGASNEEVTEFVQLLTEQGQITASQEVNILDEYERNIKGQTKKLKQNGESRRELEIVLSEAKNTGNDLQLMLNSLKDEKFSDAQVDDFIQQMKTRGALLDRDLVRYMETLVVQGNISAGQKTKFINAFKNGERVIENSGLIRFFHLCLDSHMRLGSRISSLMSFKEFHKYDAKLQQLASLYPNICYAQQLIEVEIPSHCKYYTGNQAYILTISKKEKEALEYRKKSLLT